MHSSLSHSQAYSLSAKIKQIVRTRRWRCQCGIHAIARLSILFSFILIGSSAQGQQLNAQDAQDVLASGRELEEKGSAADAAAAYLNVLDKFPSTAESKSAYESLAVLSQRLIAGEIPESEAEKFQAGIPAWNECKSPESKYILLGFAYSKAAALWQAGLRKAAAPAWEETLALSRIFLNEYPDHPLQLFAQRHMFEAAQRLGPESLAAVNEEFKVWAAQKGTLRDWTARVFAALYSERIANDMDESLVQLGSFAEEAEMGLVEAIASNPTVYDSLRSWYVYYTGHAHAHVGNYDRGAEYFRSVIDDLPDANSLHDRAAYYFAFTDEAIHLGDTEKSIAAYDTYLKQYPDGLYAPEALRRTAEVHVLKEDTVAAEKAYQEIVDRFPNDPEALTARQGLLQLAGGEGTTEELQPMLAAAVTQFCGPITLHHLLAALGHTTTVHDLAAAAGATPAGTPLDGMIRAAQAQGAALRGVRAASLDEVSVPLIAVVDEHHYVMVENYDVTHVVLRELDNAPIRVPRQVFESSWDGIALAVDSPALRGMELPQDALSKLMGADGGEGGGDAIPNDIAANCPNRCVHPGCQPESAGWGGRGLGTLELDGSGTGFDWAKRYLQTREAGTQFRNAGIPNQQYLTGINSSNITLRLNAFQAALQIMEPDISIQTLGGMKLHFYRTYHNNNGHHNGYFTEYHNGDGTAFKNNIGNGWTHSFNQHLRVSSQRGWVFFYREMGCPYTFMRTSTSTAWNVDIYEQGAMSEDDEQGTTAAEGIILWRNLTTGAFTVYYPNGLTYNFSADQDSYARLQSITDASGNAITYTYNSTNIVTGKLTRVDAPGVDPRYIEISYRPLGLMEKAELKSGSQVLKRVVYNYNNARLASVTLNDDTNLLRYEYTQATLPNTPTTGEYISRIIDRDGKAYPIVYTWQAAPNPALAGTYYLWAKSIKVTYPDNGYTYLDHPQSPLQGVFTNHNSAGTEISKAWATPGPKNRMAAHRVYKRADGTNEKWSYVSNLERDLERVIPPSLQTAPAPNYYAYTYTPTGRISSVTEPDGDQWLWSYNTGTWDQKMYPIRQTDPVNLETQYVYDTQTRIQTIRNSFQDNFNDGNLTGWSISGAWTVPNGMARSGAASGSKSIQRTANDDDYDTRFSYILHSTASNNYYAALRMRMLNTNAVRLELRFSPTQASILNYYDGVSNVQLALNTTATTVQGVKYNVRTKLVGANLKVWRSVGNGPETLLFNITNAPLHDGNRVAFYSAANSDVSYDDIVVSADDLMVPTTFTYRPTGEILTKTVGSATSTYGYSTEGYLQSITDPSGHVTTATHDGLGNITSIVSPSLNMVEYLYSDPLNPTKPTDEIRSDGTTYYYAYTRAGQLRTRVRSDLAEVREYIYDSRNRLVRVENGSGTIYTTLVRDSVGRIATATQLGEGTTTYTYDHANRLKDVAFPDGSAIHYTLDDFGMVIQALNQSGADVTSANDIAPSAHTVEMKYAAHDPTPRVEDPNTNGDECCPEEGEETQCGCDPDDAKLSITPYAGAEALAQAVLGDLQAQLEDEGALEDVELTKTGQSTGELGEECCPDAVEPSDVVKVDGSYTVGGDGDAANEGPFTFQFVMNDNEKGRLSASITTTPTITLDVNGDISVTGKDLSDCDECMTATGKAKAELAYAFNALSVPATFYPVEHGTPEQVTLVPQAKTVTFSFDAESEMNEGEDCPDIPLPAEKCDRPKYVFLTATAQTSIGQITIRSKPVKLIEAEDPCPDDDIDGDGIPNDQDGDIDGDGIPNGEDDDDDNDGVPDGGDDNCPQSAQDQDADGHQDECDNCKFVHNPDQNNVDGDEYGDACDNDVNGDGQIDETQAHAALDEANKDTGTTEQDKDSAQGKTEDGDPVQLYSGEFVEQMEDLRVSRGSVDLVWNRTYRSRFATDRTGMGDGWDYSYNIWISVEQVQGLTSVLPPAVPANYWAPLKRFILHDGGNGTTQLWTREQLNYNRWSTKDDVAHAYTLKGTLQTFWDADNRLYVKRRDGSKLTFNISDAKGLDGSNLERAYVRQIEYPDGTTLTFDYNSNKRLVEIRQHVPQIADDRVWEVEQSGGFIRSVTDVTDGVSGYKVEYNYGNLPNDRKQLESVEHVDGVATTYTYQAAPTGHYALLETIIDGNNKVYLKNVYDAAASGRVEVQKYGGVTSADVDGYNWHFNYFDGNKVGATAGTRAQLVITPTFDARIYIFELVSGTWRLKEKRDYENDYPVTATPPYAALPLHVPSTASAEFTYWATNASRAVTSYKYVDPGTYPELNLVEKVTLPDGTTENYTYDVSSDYWYKLGNMKTQTYKSADGTISKTESWQYWGLAQGYFLGNYGGRSRLPASHLDPKGNQTSYQYDSIGRVTGVTHNGTGVTEVFDYTGITGQPPYLKSYLVRQTGTSGVEYERKEQYRYDTKGFLDQVRVAPLISGLNLTTTYVNDDFGRPTTITDPEGKVSNLEYDEKGRLTRHEAPTSTTVAPGAISFRQTTDYKYDGNGNLEWVDVDNRNRAGATLGTNEKLRTSYTYDLLNHRKSEEREVDETLSEMRSFQYTKTGQLEQITEPDGRTTFATYNAQGRVSTVERRNTVGSTMSTATYIYDAVGNRTSEIVTAVNAVPRTTTWHYDNLNRLDKTTDPLGNIAGFEYDANNNVLRKTVTGTYYGTGDTPSTALLLDTTFTYDALDRVSTETQWVFEPAAGVLTRPGTATASINTLTYFGLDRPRTVKDPQNNVWTNVYDEAGRLLTTTDPKANVHKLYYDLASNVIREDRIEKNDVTGGLATYTVTTQYDGLDRPMRLRELYTNASGQPDEDVTELAYDGQSQLIYVKDAKGRTVDNTIDGLGRLRAAAYKDPGGTLVAGYTLEYNPEGQLIGRADSTGNMTTYTYNVDGRVEEQIFADGTSESYGYNGLGEMQSFADANETDVPRTYDLLGRLLTRTGGGINETLRYDGLGNVVYAASTGSTVRRTFDSRALMRGESLAFTSGPSYQTQYEYDSRGANTKIVYPSGRDIRHTYSTAGVLEEVQDYTSTPVTLARYKNLGTDRVLERFYRPGAGTEAVQRYTYDGKGRVSGTKSQVTSATAAFDWRTNAWDRMNNRTDRRVLDPTDSSGNTALRSFTYAYDDLDRMTGSSRTEGTGAPTAITYALDQSGNRTNVTGDVNWGAYSMVGIPPNSVHAYEQTPYDTGPRNYDDNGNYTGKSGETIAYDGRNRMSSYTDAGGTTTYQYDALGRRIAKTASGVTTHFVYAVEHVIEEHSGGVLKASYVYGAQLDEVLQMKRDVDANGTMEDYWYHQDDMLNVVAVTNASGAVVERYEYKDYGLPEIYDDSWNLRTGGTAIGNTLMFNGRPYDAESGLYNFRARYLDPKTGRFTSRDPMGMWHDGLNLGNGYTYCNNNPWSMRDPFGLEAGGNEKNWFERMKDKWNDFWDWVGESSVNDYDAFAHNDMVDVVDMYSDPNYNGEYSRVLAAAMFSEFRERLTQGAIEASMTSLGIVADAVIGKVAGDVLGKVLGIVSRPLGAMLGKAIRKGMGWVDNAVMAGRNFGNWAGSALRSMFGTSSRIVRSEAFAGIKAASQVLQNAGVPRAARVQILQSFEAGTVNVGRAGANQFGLRYFGGNAPEYGRFLFDTFPASRQSLALRPEFNAMTSLRQFQIRPGATMITGRIAPQGLGYEGGQIQYFVIDPVRDLLP